MSTGDYVLDQREGEGPERLRRSFEEWLDPLTRERLEIIGVQTGWKCLEIGPGAGSMTRWLCERVGREGRVVAIDLNPRFISELRYPQLEVREADIAVHKLEESAFDLAYVRWTLTHIPERRGVIEKMVRSLRPGGWLLCIERDTVTYDVDESVPADLADRHVANTDEPAARADRERRGVDPQLGRRLFGWLRQLGMEEVDAEGRTRPQVGGTARALGHRATMAQFMRARGVPDEEVRRRVTYWDDPSFAVWSPLAVATWGRKPA